jgi:hypothetical protein
MKFSLVGRWLVSVRLLTLQSSSVPADQPRDIGLLALVKKNRSQQEQSGIVAQKFSSCGKLSKQFFCRANSSTCN